MLLRRVVRLLALVLGTLGLAACVAGGWGVWSVTSHVRQANDRAFTLVDERLSAAQDRLRAVRDRVREARVTTDQIADAVRRWSAGEAVERLREQTDLRARAETFSRHLQTADRWLDAAADAAQAGRQLLELAQSAGAAADPAALDEAIARLTSVRDTLAQTGEVADRVREWAADAAEDRRAGMTSLLVRTLATFADVDGRLDKVVDRLEVAQENARHANERANGYITLTAIGCYALLMWMAAGQAALCWWGWVRAG